MRAFESWTGGSRVCNSDVGPFHRPRSPPNHDAALGFNRKVQWTDYFFAFFQALDVRLLPEGAWSLGRYSIRCRKADTLRFSPSNS